VATVVAAVVARPANLEPPDVITELDTVDQLRLGQFGEVPVDRGPVEAAAAQGRRDVGMRPRTLRGFKMLQDGQPGRRASQAGRADSRATSLAVGSSGSWGTRHGLESTGGPPLPSVAGFEHPHDG